MKHKFGSNEFIAIFLFILGISLFIISFFI